MTAPAPASPRTQVQAWLNGIGADHITVHDAATTGSMTVQYAIERIEDLRATHTVIDHFGLRAAALCGDTTVAILHTPTYDGHIIRWEKIA